jgi:hypothetical protein
VPPPAPDIANRVSVMTEWAESAADRGEAFVFVRIPEHILPLDREEKYEEPIHSALTDAGLGRVTGGGQQLGEGKTIAYCGVDVNLTDRERGLELLRVLLPKLGAPPGTVVEEFLPEFVEHPVGEVQS